jgi:peptide/nickel transport system substrate-binding protein
MVEAAAKELDSAKRVAMYERMQRLAQERAPFVMLLQAISTGVQGKGVSDFVIGPLPDYTRYYGIRKT